MPQNYHLRAIVDKKCNHFRKRKSQICDSNNPFRLRKVALGVSDDQNRVGAVLLHCEDHFLLKLNDDKKAKKPQQHQQQKTNFRSSPIRRRRRRRRQKKRF